MTNSLWFCSCGEVETTLAAASTRMVVLGCLLANPEHFDLSHDSEEVEHDWSEQSSVARLVNAMASLRRGRNYLGECEATKNLTLPRNLADLHFIQLDQEI